MRKGPVVAAVMGLLLNEVMAVPIGDPVLGAAPTTDAAQANWHGGRHRGGGGGQGGNGGDGGGDGSVIVGFPNPSGSGAPFPYPYPGSPRPAPSHTGATDASPQRPWPMWYYCDQPTGYYPYVKVCAHDWQRLPVMPPPPGSGAPIGEGFWQHCDDPNGYFPYVAQCSHHWTAVIASIPVPSDDPDGIPVIGQWFYCQDAKDYLPYAGSCPHVWLTIPAVPPPNMQPANKPKAAADQR